MRRVEMMNVMHRFRGCLLGGAVGDALGAAVEFDSLAAILARFGPSGIRDFMPAYGRVGAINDDTQMTLFTAEGLLRSWVRGRQEAIVSVESVAEPRAAEGVRPGWVRFRVSASTEVIMSEERR